MKIKEIKANPETTQLLYEFEDTTFHISYNNFANPEIRDSGMPDSKDETALVLKTEDPFTMDEYLILNGDHRATYFALANLEECINYFTANIQYISSWSNRQPV